jgi:hypothetical protein
MSLVLLAVAAGVLAGWIRGGDLSRVAGTRIHGWPLLLLGLGALLLVDALDPARPAALVACAIGALVVVAVRNAHLVGFPVIVLGLLTNLTVLLLNGTMPVDPDALVAAGIVEADALDRAQVTGARHLLRPDDRATFLADIVPVPIVRQVVSFGDLIVLVGVADAVANQLCRRRRRRPLPAGAEAALLSIGPPVPPPDGLGIDLRATRDAAHWEPPLPLARPPAVIRPRVDPAAEIPAAQTGDPAQTSTATPAQDWGTAPSPSPVSGSQYSARPLRSAPRRRAAARAAASGAERRDAANQRR